MNGCFWSGFRYLDHNIIMQTIKKIFHTTVLRSDLLSTSATLRYKGEAQYESFALGIISILTVGAFITIFAFSFVQVL